MPHSYAIGKHFQRFILEQVASASEVVRTALVLLEGRERMRPVRLEDLRAEILKGLDSGAGKSAQDVFARLEGKYAAMAASGGAMRPPRKDAGPSIGGAEVRPNAGMGPVPSSRRSVPESPGRRTTSTCQSGGGLGAVPFLLGAPDFAQTAANIAHGEPLPATGLASTLMAGDHSAKVTAARSYNRAKRARRL